ncbi:type II toxin-antitoxin system prevent-host-death family antitoxin [Skermanella mucosa]|uniref:type II toxin-antitoxin system Phd/YefM family antitoxin n=1 Tax=Skermanella mucosa TaxID=1789672 RepID=UPI00192B07F7|nr:type II toxin-antitoxin system prevent-host-death family antitoxin [Skermanella mucosa]UEM20476.1 type II toxin-antitoxin system prevent-host-death family antitoxin [Skermanella mucosa]
MSTANLADAKAELGELVAKAASGEEVCIIRRSRPISLAMLRAHTETMSAQTGTAGDFVRTMRDDSRH